MLRRLSLIVIDTNVLVSALRSRRGLSFQILSDVGTNKFSHAVSTAVVLEYEAVLLQLCEEDLYSRADIEVIVDYLIGSAVRVAIHYRWRPFLRDPGDECLLELAVASGADAIVTFNERDFSGVEAAFGVNVLKPLQFLKQIEAVP
jgi:putative PIN family toxin of toxin-antitoxin system